MLRWIDSHMHLGSDEDGSIIKSKDIQELFDKQYIDKAIVFCFDEEKGIDKGNKKIKKVVKQKDKLIGLYRIDPELQKPSDLRGLNFFSGFKLHPHAQESDISEMEKYTDVLSEIGKPLLVHIGHWGEKPHPQEVIDFASKNKSFEVILAHSLRGYYFKASEEFKKKLIHNDNIYIDLSFQASPSAVKVLVNEIGANRLLFASDYPYGHPIPVKKSIQLADISEEKKEKIAYKNAKRIFEK